ncbi:NRDE family protein [Microbacterium sp. SS28]|uniref:NRDE family protein n=1 Tax=Microbacterium sp. SS28 TaxID=2919948 RepID=UPI001FAA6898|nr:NRDE family protein [Microbacterium sp. SS28]
MCTVIVHVPESPDEPTRLLAVRDEDPARAWDPLGDWWPQAYPGVVGVRDARAGGAWLAADADRRRLAVLLNRADEVDVPESEVVSRGGVVLESVAGRRPGEHPHTHGFNLVEVEGPRVAVTTWNGVESRTVDLAPGTHMIAHDDVDDDTTPRIARWLETFAETPGQAAASLDWFSPWLALLERSSSLEPTDDDAIIRDNRPLGYPTLSLLVCIASIGPAGVDLAYGAFDEPGRWNALPLT